MPARRLTVVHLVRGQRRQFQKRRAVIEQPIDRSRTNNLPCSRCRFCILAPALPCDLEVRVILHQPPVVRRIGFEVWIVPSI
jgi:hypothetical protein